MPQYKSRHTGAVIDSSVDITISGSTNPIFNRTGTTISLANQNDLLSLSASGMILSGSEDSFLINNSKIARNNFMFNNTTGISSDSMPIMTYIGNNQITISSSSARIFETSDFSGELEEYIVPATTILLTPQILTWIVIRRIGETLFYDTVADVDSFNHSDVLPIHVVYLYNNAIFSIPYDKLSYGLANRLNNRLVRLDNIRLESGMIISVSGSSQVIEVSSGIAWRGTTRLYTPSSKTDDVNPHWMVYHSASVWQNQLTTTASNTLYDDGTNLVPLPYGGYNSLWVYSVVASTYSASIAYTLGTNSGSFNDALISGIPNAPDYISEFTILVGKIIFQSGSNIPAGVYSIKSATENTISPVTSHGALSGLDKDDHKQYLNLIGRAGQVVDDNLIITKNLKVSASLNIGNNQLGFFPFSDLQVVNTVDGYYQINLQNHSIDTAASSDYVATNDVGTDTTYYVDLGINGSNYKSGLFYSASHVMEPNDSYLIAQTQSLSIIIESPGDTGSINFVVGGYTDDKIRMQVTEHTVLVTGSLKYIDGNQSSSKVLMSDANGNANWNSLNAYVNNLQTSSMSVLTSSYALTSSYSNTLKQNVVITGSLSISGSITSSGLPFILYAGHDAISPGTGSIYYFGNVFNLAASLSSVESRHIYIGMRGTIKRVSMNYSIGGTVASAEPAIITLRNLVTSQSVILTNSQQYNISEFGTLFTLSSPLQVNIGDKVDIQISFPVWVTKPTSLRHFMNLYAETN